MKGTHMASRGPWLQGGNMLTAPVTRVARAAMEGNKGTITTQKPEHNPRERKGARAHKGKNGNSRSGRELHRVPTTGGARKVGRGQI